LDFGVVALIAVLINTIGFLEGVTVGMGLAIVLFVAQYSRTPSIRHTLTGVSYQSNVTRSRLHAQLLRRKGDWLHILELQGFIFFGTANQILEKVRARLASSSESHPPRFIILDFRLVTGFDASAAFSFAKILRLLQARDIHLVLTHLTPQMQASLAKDLPPGRVHYFKDLDHGLEWCENEMAASFESAGLAQDEASLYDQLSQAMPNPQAVETLQERLTHSEANPGECIIRQGDPQCGLYMIESGRVTIYLETDEGGLVRLRSLGAGSFFGEMGVYTRRPASANVTADQPTHFYHLSSTDLEHLETSAPDVAAALHRFVAAYLSERLAKMTATVQSLLH
jgi:sulfate permease, SulP family